jgi:sugar/nucleoside kinase (ribokinase family)
MMKVIGLGNALVDILVQLDSDDIVNTLGFPKGSMQLIDSDAIPRIAELIDPYSAVLISGGSAANTIHGLSSLGTKTGFFGKVGKDEMGEFYMNDLKTAGVESTLLRSDTVTGRAYTLITPDTERTFATYLGAAVEMTEAEISRELFANYQMLHIEGYLVQNTMLIEQALKMAKSEGLKISLDLASFNVVESNLEFLKRVIPDYVDIVFANEEEAHAFTGKDPENALQELGDICDIAVVKTGKEGSLILSEGNMIKIGVIEVKALDTTGAGDQYAAGFIHGLSLGMSMDKCGELGSLLAGTVIENYGARIPEKLWSSVLKKVEKIKNS